MPRAQVLVETGGEDVGVRIDKLRHLFSLAGIVRVLEVFEISLDYHIHHDHHDHERKDTAAIDLMSITINCVYCSQSCCYQ